MKHLRLGVILLALLLAAMAIVPMVSAGDKSSMNESITSSLPQLQFEANQKNVLVHDELKLDNSTESSQIMKLVQESEHPL
jgi:ABC-type lipoprotein release transport system permease subunit